MDRLIELLPQLWDATLETLFVATAALIFGGLAGLVLGLALYATRAGSIFPNRVVFGTLNVIVNTFRPIPFIILLLALQPIARGIGLPGIGVPFAIFAITIASLFAISRIVEQNLLTVRPGVIEAARAAGASRSRILFRLVPRESLGPLVLGYTFVGVALVELEEGVRMLGELRDVDPAAVKIGMPVRATYIDFPESSSGPAWTLYAWEPDA